MSQINAPWTDEQVSALNNFQRAGKMHPFTCANRGDGSHREHNGDLGGLEATPEGWVCVSCDYTQTWAHDLMAQQETEQ